MSARLEAITASGINPALKLLPASMDSERARVMLCAIVLQESRAIHRRQLGNGPARGLGQFEEGGGVVGVMTHPASRKFAMQVCEARQVPFKSNAIWRTLETDDVLALAFCRLLLYTDPRPLPGLSQVDAAWRYYVENWRPGKPHRSTWNLLHFEAVNFVMSEVM